MTNEDRLKKAIKKAVENGWDDSDGLNGSYLDKDISGVIIGIWHIEKIIFSPDFAKAYWGEEMIDTDILDDVWMSDDGEVAEYKTKPAWQYHQHRMLDEIQAGRNPLKYLEKFL